MRVGYALILSTASIAALALPTSAFGQTSAPVDTTPEKTAEGEALPPSSAPTNAEGQPAAETPPTESGGAIVVTGSRIRRNNFNTPQNVDIVTRDDQVLAGTRSTSEALQSANVTSGTSQISGSFLGFLSDNGQGANVVGLRGLGAQRTLVLLNGRRLAPAGVGAQLVAADLNTLPTSVVQRIEILREGASSIYGSDAIAGVINVITDTEIDGLTLDGYADVPQIGDGQTIRGSITAGKTFSRGHIMASFEYREDKGLTYGSREDTRCQRELAYVNGKEVGQLKPFSTELRCYPYARAGSGVAAGYTLGTAYVGFVPGPARISFADYYTGNPNIFGPPIAVALNNNDFNNRTESRSNVLDTTFLTPLKTYTGYVNGSYELGALGNAELYGEGLFVRRKTKQRGPDRPDWLSASQSVQVYGPDLYEIGDGLLEYYYPSIVSPFFPVSWRDAGILRTFPLYNPEFLPGTKQKVDFWRINGGMRGDLGIGDWRYDGNIQYSKTKARDDRQALLTENITNTGIAVLAPAGTPQDFITVAIPGQLGAGNSYTCASNVTNGAYNGGTCQPLNLFDPAVMIDGQITRAQIDYLYPWWNYTKTDFEQKTFSLSFDGSLFALPGGDIKAAVGVEYRHDKIDDRPGEVRLDGLAYRYGTAARTKGSDNVKEVYGELSMPFFRDRPFAHLLEVDVSGRYTDYKSYGSDFTYHVGAQWAPVEAIRFRGNYGTNFRAPNLYEQFVADEVGFYPNSFDPCVNFANNSAPGQPLYENCLAELTQFLGSQAAALAYNPNGGGFQITTTGGAGNIKAETAKTWGVGVVLTVPKRIADLSLAIDYWNINVKGEVGQLQNLILTFCYTSTDFPNNFYCDLIGDRYTPANAPNASSIGNIINFQNPFLNIARQLSAGVDFDARYATRLFGGQFSTQLQATRMTTQKIEFYPGAGLSNFNGTLGYPGFGSGPKWTGSLDTRFKTGNGITFRWGIEYIGKMSSQGTENVLFLNEQGAVCAQGSAGCFQVYYDLAVPSYFEHGASVQWLWKNIGQVTMGVSNIFDKDPPTISDDNVAGFPRYGNFFANGAYDYRGRSFFINVTRSF